METEIGYRLYKTRIYPTQAHEHYDFNRVDRPIKKHKDETRVHTHFRDAHLGLTIRTRHNPFQPPCKLRNSLIPLIQLRSIRGKFLTNNTIHTMPRPDSKIDSIGKETIGDSLG